MSSLLSSVGSMASSAGSSIGSGLESAGSAALNGLESAGSAIGSGLESVGSAAGDAASWMGNQASSFKDWMLSNPQGAQGGTVSSANATPVNIPASGENPNLSKILSLVKMEQNRRERERRLNSAYALIQNGNQQMNYRRY